MRLNTMSPMLTGDEVISAVLASHAVHLPAHAAMAFSFSLGNVPSCFTPIFFFGDYEVS